MTLCSDLKNNLFKNLLLDSEYPGNSKEFCFDQKVYFVHLGDLVPTLCGFNYQGFHLVNRRVPLMWIFAGTKNGE